MLEELMLKVSDNMPLTPRERDLLSQGIRELVQIKSEYRDKKLERPTITDPDFRSSPLKVFHCYIPDSSPVSINNDTLTPVTFVSSGGDNSIFDFYQNDKSKIRIDRGQFNVRIDGVLSWAADADGYRVVAISVHDSAGTQIASKELSVVEAVETANIPTRMNFSYTEDIRGIFPNGVYFTMYVKHEAGAALNLADFVMSVSIA